MTSETTTTTAPTINAETLFTENERSIILALSGWNEYEDERLRLLYGDPRGDASAESEATADAGKADDEEEEDRLADSNLALLNFLNGDGGDETTDPLGGGGDESGLDTADGEPSTEELLKEFFGPRYDFLTTIEARKRLLSELTRQVQSSVLFKRDAKLELLYSKLLHFFGHIPAETLDAVRIALGSRSGGAGGYASEADKKRVFADYLYGIPFGITTTTNPLSAVRKTLEDSLYGLKEAKGRVLEHITLSRHGNGRCDPILLIGPPGTGKTALGGAIASSLGVPFSKISLAGMADHITLRGSNSTWGSAQPGLLLKEQVRCKCVNYVSLIDELDKSAGYGSGRVIDVFAELLDPRQNDRFRDLFMEIELDFSRVLFVCTANEIGDIPSYILDRCSVIDVPAYTLEERSIIIENYMPKQIVSDYRFNFEIEIAGSASKEFARSHESLREARRAVMSHVSSMLEHHEPGCVPKLLIKKYRPELVPPPSKGEKNRKSRRIAGFASARGDDNPPQGGSQGPGPGM